MERAILAQGDKELSYCPIFVELRRASCYGYRIFGPGFCVPMCLEQTQVFPRSRGNSNLCSEVELDEGGVQ